MDKILVLDFGGQYNQLIARRVREQHVYAQIRSCHQISPNEILKEGFKGVILTGGPNSVYAPGAPGFDKKLLELGIPLLGICYGAQLLAYLAGGEVAPAEDAREYGRTLLKRTEHPILQGMPEEGICWMSHTDQICRLPDSFKTIASTDKCRNAAICDDRRRIYAVQFHPEVTHTVKGDEIFKNFLFSVCGCRADWKMDDYAKKSIEHYRLALSGKKVLLALSGGVDSSVAALLLHKAIGKNLVCVFVDHGLLRKNEAAFVEQTFKKDFGLNMICVNARARFLEKLKGVTDPETKRRIIGEEFIRVFEEEAGKLGHIHALAQGTIYPDVIESGKGDSAVIKSHHNVGGLPDVISFDEIVEPLRDLFKDEVREIGSELGLPDQLVWRQPFPGPGLAVRILGEITEEKISILQDADAIYREEIEKAGPEFRPDQYFAVLTNARSVGVMGDARTYGYTIALRAVSTDDFMTAEWTRLPYEVLERAGSRIPNEVGGISRVVFDITSKPPATVEWE